MILCPSGSLASAVMMVVPTVIFSGMLMLTISVVNTGASSTSTSSMITTAEERLS